jgi:integrase
MDAKLQEALRLIAENPAVIQAALALASASPTVEERKPTIAERWAEWEPWGALELGGDQSNAWRTAKAHRAVWARTILPLDDGRKVAVESMTAEEITPRVCEIYRSVRQVTPNGRKRKDGAPDVVKPTTVNRELSTLKSMINYFVRVRKTMSSHPMIGWQRVDEEPYARKTYLNDEKARRFIEAGPPMFQDIMTVCLRAAGMRQSEVRLLRKSEIDWDEKTINLPAGRNKNRRGRSIPIPDDVADILSAASARSKGEYVFVSPRDPQRLKPISTGTWQGWLTKARDRSGVTGFDGENVCTRLHEAQSCNRPHPGEGAGVVSDGRSRHEPVDAEAILEVRAGAAGTDARPHEQAERTGDADYSATVGRST